MHFNFQFSLEIKYFETYIVTKKSSIEQADPTVRHSRSKHESTDFNFGSPNLNCDFLDMNMAAKRHFIQLSQAC